MFRLIYSSQTHKDMSPEEITEIAKHARRRNARDGISGLLLYHDRKVFQVLEGEERAVRACYARVRSDTRHFAVRTVSEKPAKTRAFTKWYLGCRDPRALPITARAGALTFDQIEARLDAVADLEDVREGKQSLAAHLGGYLAKAH